MAIELISTNEDSIQLYGDNKLAFQSRDPIIILCGPSDTGKAQPISEPILTPTGFKPMGEIAKGDYVIARSGMPTKVLDTFKLGKRDIYEIQFSDGSSTRACEEHLWIVRKEGDNKDYFTDTKRLKEIIKNSRYFIPRHGCVVFNKTPENSGGNIFKLGGSFVEFNKSGRTYSDGYLKIINSITLGSVQQRFEFLSGIYSKFSEKDKIKIPDSKFIYFYCPTSDTNIFIDTILFLVRSLGGYAKLSDNRKEIKAILPSYSNNGVVYADSWVERYVVSIEKEPQQESVQCISVEDFSELYLTKDFIVTHNTFSMTLKMHMFALKYPGAHILLCRKSQTALRKSAVKTYEDILRLTGCYSGPNKVRKLGESRPTEFIYPHAENSENGVVYSGESSIVIAPVDSKGHALGSEYDMIYCNQPDTGGLTKSEFLTLSSRCSGRRGHTPYSQLISDPNPAFEGHWLKTGESEGLWKIYNSTHKDNPQIFDPETGQLTESGKARLESLQRFSGTDRDRLLDGLWFSTDGLKLMEYYDHETHSFSLSDVHKPHLADIIDRWEEVPHWENYLIIDWGWDHPFCAALWAKVPDRDLYIRHKLVYRKRKSTNENAKMVLEMTQGHNIVLALCDRNPNEQAIFENETGIKLQPVNKGTGSVSTGWNIVIDELQNNRIMFLDIDDALVHPRCEVLLSEKKPSGFQEEVGNLRNNPNDPGGIIKENDEDADCTRYLFFTLRTKPKRKESVLFI